MPPARAITAWATLRCRTGKARSQKRTEAGDSGRPDPVDKMRDKVLDGVRQRATGHRLDLQVAPVHASVGHRDRDKPVGGQPAPYRQVPGEGDRVGELGERVQGTE
jgi:hypothetical protein